MYDYVWTFGYKKIFNVDSIECKKNVETVYPVVIL